MKLVIATPLYPPEPGGPATYSALLEKHLPPKGVEVELVKFSDVRHLPKLLRHIAYFFRVRSALKKADTLLVLDPVSTGLPAALAALSLKKPYVAKIVGDYAWEQGTRRFNVTETLDEFVLKEKVPFQVQLLKNVQVWVATHAHTLLVPSEYLKSIVMSWGDIKPPIVVIHNAAEVSHVGSVPEEVQKAEKPLIVTVGRLVPWKGIAELIEAKNELPGTLVIVGDGPEKATLERQIREGGAQAIVVGSLSHENTLAVLKEADVFVLNSSYEGLSHVLIEALSLGVPIVTTDAGGNREVITNEREGIVIPVGDTARLQEAITTQLAASRGVPSERFSVDRMIEKTVTALTSAV